MKQFLKSKKNLYELEHTGTDVLYGDNIYLHRYGENNTGNQRVRPAIQKLLDKTKKLDLSLKNEGVPIRTPMHRIPRISNQKIKNKI